MNKRILSIVGVIGITLGTTGCQLFEDGSARLDDGTGFCLFPELGCSGPMIGPPPVPVETVDFFDMEYGPCAEAPKYNPMVSYAFFPDYDGDKSRCSVTGTSEDLDQLFESAWRDQ